LSESTESIELLFIHANTLIIHFIGTSNMVYWA